MVKENLLIKNVDFKTFNFQFFYKNTSDIYSYN